jgi:adenine deaminase
MQDAVFKRLPTDRAALVEAACGRRPLDLVVRNVNLVNVLTCEIYPADIGVYGERIAVVGAAGAYGLEAKVEIDGTGKWACPGYFDAHLHIESTMVTPANYAAGVLPFGTTTAVIDPHEIGNVMGLAGVRAMIEGSEGLPLRVYVAVPSCVPSVLGHETAGALFDAAEITEMLTWPRVISLAEVMDYIGVIGNDPRMRRIVDAALERGVNIQGHAPRLVGRELNAYIAAGIDNDHESRLGPEVLEKLRLGLLPLVKLGSHGNHLPRLMPSLLEAQHVDVALCTDDVEPADLLVNGHMDRVVRGVMAYGVPPARAIRWACYIGPQHYGLRDFGAIAPGFIADFQLLASLDEVRTSDVFVGGRHVVADGRLKEAIPDPLKPQSFANSVRTGAVTADDFTIAGPQGPARMNAIHLLPTRLTTLAQIALDVPASGIAPETLPADACMLSVVPRHGQGGRPTAVPLLGLGLARGAIAHTVAHDCHNLLVAGRSGADMAAAVAALRQSGGGFVLVEDGVVVAEVPLPLAGLMSFEPCEVLSEQIERFNAAARERGIQPDTATPIVAMTGIALAVIPEVRITDKHPLFDVETQKPLPLFV